MRWLVYSRAPLLLRAPLPCQVRFIFLCRHLVTFVPPAAVPLGANFAPVLFALRLPKVDLRQLTGLRYLRLAHQGTGHVGIGHGDNDDEHDGNEHCDEARLSRRVGGSGGARGRRAASPQRRVGFTGVAPPSWRYFLGGNLTLDWDPDFAPNDENDDDDDDDDDNDSSSGGGDGDGDDAGGRGSGGGSASGSSRGGGRRRGSERPFDASGGSLSGASEGGGDLELWGGASGGTAAAATTTATAEQLRRQCGGGGGGGVREGSEERPQTSDSDSAASTDEGSDAGAPDDDDDECDDDDEYDDDDDDECGDDGSTSNAGIRQQWGRRSFGGGGAFAALTMGDEWRLPSRSGAHNSRGLDCAPS